MAKSQNSKDTQASRLEKLIPERIRTLLGDPAVLPFENVNAFENLRSELFSYFNPENDFIECLIVDEIAKKQWDIGRLATMQGTVVDLALPAAAVTLLPRELERELDTLHVSDRDVAPLIRHANLGNVEDREVLGRLMGSAGVTTYMLQVTAYSQTLELLTGIEDMKNNLERRRDQLIRTLEERRRMKATMSPSAKAIKGTSVEAEVKST